MRPRRRREPAILDTVTAVNGKRSSYRQVLANRRLTGLLAGDAIAKVGDGMGFIASPLIALRLRGSLDPALAISLVSVAPYLLAVVLSLGFGLGRRRFNPRIVLLADATLRGGTLLAVGAFAVVDQLPLWILVAALVGASALRLLAASSRRLVASNLAGDEGRLAVNGLLGTSDSLALFVAGPALGGLVAALSGPAVVLVINGAANLVLLGAVLVVLPGAAADEGEQQRAAAPTVSGWSIMSRVGIAAQLLFVVFLFYLFYGPVEVALPLLVTGHLHAGSGALGVLWTAFGVGALVGSLLTNALRGFSQASVLLAIMAGWAACVGVLAASSTVAVAAGAMAIGGVVYGPFTAIAYTLLQDTLRHDEQQPVLAVWAAGTTLAAPLGLAMGGPLVAATGARSGLAVSAAVTVLLVPAAFFWLRRARSRPDD
jgi:hypothetical protein